MALIRCQNPECGRVVWAATTRQKTCSPCSGRRWYRGNRARDQLKRHIRERRKAADDRRQAFLETDHGKRMRAAGLVRHVERTQCERCLEVKCRCKEKERQVHHSFQGKETPCKSGRNRRPDLAFLDGDFS